MRVSYSAVQSWRACEQQYFYSYVDKLKPKLAQAPLELGTLIHNFMEALYSEGTFDAGKKALKKDAKEVRSMAKLAADLGSDDTANELLAIPRTAKRLMSAYYRVHGKNDLETHRIVMAERWFQLEVKKGIYLPGKIDLITEHDDEYYLWEHKTTGNIPKATSRFSDLQTLLYVVAAQELWDINISNIRWNYIRTTPPHYPTTLKSGRLSVAKNNVTTVGLVKKAIKDGGHDISEYREYLGVVARGERQKGFVRYDLPVPASREKILLRDYVTSVEQIEDLGKREQPPVRNIGRQCDWCGFRKLCQAAVAGGDTDGLIEANFTKKKARKGGTNGKEENEIKELLEAE